VKVKELRTALKKKLPEYMVPAIIVQLEQLPVSANGKVDRKALPKPDENRSATNTYFVPPETEAELKIAAIWREILTLSAVGKTDNFFDLGGNSLLLAQVNLRLRESFDRKISLIEMFKYPTIGSLAEHISRTEFQQSSQATLQVRANLRLESMKTQSRHRQARSASQIAADVQTENTVRPT
jgi:acyl carrier protein